MSNARWPTQARFWHERGFSHVTDLVRRTKLNCALGTNAFSPQRAESFRHFLLVPDPYRNSEPQRLEAASVSTALRHEWNSCPSRSADAGRRIFESALERVRRSFRLQVYGCVVMPEHVQSSGDRAAPLRPKAGLGGRPASSVPVQLSLRDMVGFLAIAPGVETPGYYQASLRDAPVFDS
jgi:hypothetical protein